MKIALSVTLRQARKGDVAFAGDFEHTAARLAGLGYDGAELQVRDPASVDVPALKKTLARFRLEVPVIATGLAWTEDRLSLTDPHPAVRMAAVARIRAQIALASELETMVMIGLMRGRHGDSVGRGHAMDWLLEGLRACADFAAARVVRLVIEPIDRFEADLIHSTQEGLALLDQLGCSHVGLVLDTFHMNIEDVSLEESIRAAADRLFHFHLSDSNRWYPGAGHIDFGSIIRTLREVGYAGYLTGEFLPRPDAETAAQRCIENMRPLI
jgi:sugar phosphate isomerase/epimerase